MTRATLGWLLFGAALSAWLWGALISLVDFEQAVILLLLSGVGFIVAFAVKP